jgi:DUF1680 family protein
MQLVPECPNAKMSRGYLTLPAGWVTNNQSFTLLLPLQPRWLTQGINATTSGLLTLARGPIMYCVEDVDNPWVDDHFKVRLRTRVSPSVHEETNSFPRQRSLIPMLSFRNE